MAINEIARDIVNFPGGTPKTITLDIAKVVTVGGSPEGDEVFVMSAATTATASGGLSIQNIFRNEMRRGYALTRALSATVFNVPANYGLKIAIDEAIGNGVDIELNEDAAATLDDIAQDIELKLRATAKIGEGGAKAGDLSYLNAQVRVTGGRLRIDSGTLSDRFSGAGRSSVALGAPDSLTDARELLGFDIPILSEDLAARQLANSTLAGDYTSGDIIEVTSTAGFLDGDAFEVRDVDNSQICVISGVGTGAGLSASQIRFVTASGAGTGLDTTYSGGALVRKLHTLHDPNPVSATTTVDELYRFAIDSIVNQIDFSA